MELPHTCEFCRTLQMVDYDKLQTIGADELKANVYYACENCRKLNFLYITTSSLMDAVEKVSRMPLSYSKRGFHVKKVLHKAIHIQVKYGSM